MLLTFPLSLVFTEHPNLMAISPNPQRLQPKTINPTKKGQNPTPITSSALASTPKEGQYTTEPSKATSAKTGWILVGGGLASLAILVGFFNRKTILSWFKKAKKEPSPVGKTGETAPPLNYDNFDGLKPERNIEAVKALCNEVMVLGNGINACQTMACFNSLRLLVKLAEVEPSFAGDLNVKRIKAMLGTADAEGLKNKAFYFFKALKPEAFNQLLAGNRVNSEASNEGQTILMEHFLTQYALNYSAESFHFRENTYDKEQLRAVLARLCLGEIGQLGGSPFRNNHSVSLVGICEDEVGKIDKLLDKLLNDDFYPLIAEACKGIDLLIFDQLKGNKEESFDRLPLFELIRQDTDTGAWTIRLYPNKSMQSKNGDLQEWEEVSLEQAIIRALPQQWGDILTDDFHQKLIETGDQFFMPNNP
jgi:hypothetical protein